MHQNFMQGSTSIAVGLQHWRITVFYGKQSNYSVLITTCFDAIEEKKFTNLMFLGIKKTFDTVCHKKLLLKLHHYGIRGIANHLLKSYLTERKQSVSLNDITSTTLTVEYGVPQDIRAAFISNLHK